MDATSDNISFYAEPADLAASAVDDSELVRLLSVPDVGCKRGPLADWWWRTAPSLSGSSVAVNTPFYLGEEGVTLYTNVARCVCCKYVDGSRSSFA